jgi:nucleoside-diphosphate-sugar epimerase
MRVVVTGATGNVGTAVLRALTADPAIDEITGIARRRPAAPPSGVEIHAADVASADLEPLLRGADAVVHLAWLIQPSRDERVTAAVNVDGSRRVFEAAARAGVGTVIHASSIGAYAPGPKDERVDEAWPSTGIPSSFYSRHKAAVERILDRFEERHADMRVVRLRPALIFQRRAASEIRRLFAGPLLPGALLRPGLIPLLPLPDRLRVQAVHADDVAQAYRLALTREDARGAYNVAAEPVLGPQELAQALGARRVPAPGALLRLGAAATWRARLQPTPEGWADLGLGVPLMSVQRIREELGWVARRTSVEALQDLLAGMRRGEGWGTPPLARRAGGPARVREVATGVGAVSP